MGTSQQESLYHVILEGCDVSYDIAEGGRVIIRGAILGGTGGRVMIADKMQEPSMITAADGLREGQTD